MNPPPTATENPISPVPGAARATRAISFNVNGKPVTVTVDPKRTLLDILREELDITSPKNGCAPQAQCGCCTVLIDDKAKLSCALAIEKIEGKSVVTLEGVEQQKRDQVSECFVRSGGLQCGFCIPGFVARAVGFIDEKPNPTRQEIATAIRPHLCRCTGYTKIVDAIEMYAAVRRGEALPAEDPNIGGVGTRLPRYRGEQFALGDWNYIDDIKVEGMLYAAMRLADHPRAKVLAIDATPAMALKGVHKVITAADVPGDRIVGLIYKDWPIFVAIGEETRYEGDVIACVVAETQALAREAAAALDVQYEVLKAISSPEDGLLPDAPKIHAKGNLMSNSIIKRGDAEKGLAEAAFIAEDHFETQRIEHMFLEPESCIAMPWEATDASQSTNGFQPKHQTNGHGPTVNALRVLSQGQGIFDDQRQIASILGWEKDRVRVELVSNGGGFGGKEDLSIQGQTALAAYLVAAPVKCTLTREESIRVHVKRHPVKVHMKMGCDAEGRLTAVWARILGDKGAYASVGGKVLERAAGHATGPYRLPAVDVIAQAVFTNNPPCGAMRGFGANQSAFAVEQLLNVLAKKVGINEWEIRSRNILEQGDTFCTGQRLTKPFGMRKTLDAVKEQFLAAKYAGIACGIKNTGIGNGMPDEGKCVMTVEASDRIAIRTGFTEMGQGYFTIQIQVAVEETGLPASTFKPTTDTSVDVNTMQTTASRATVLGSAAILDACKKLKPELDAAGGDLGKLVGKSYTGYYGCTYTTKLGADVADPKTHLTYGFATQVVILDDDGKLKKVIAAHDVGRVMNPTLLEGQMQGSIHMGLGYALTEDLPTNSEARLISKNIKDCGVLRAPHMPEMELIFIEENDPETAYGARGVGEIGLVPTAPAVASALEKYDGVVRRKLPMKNCNAAQAIINPAWKPAKKA